MPLDFITDFLWNDVFCLNGMGIGCVFPERPEFGEYEQDKKERGKGTVTGTQQPGEYKSEEQNANSENGVKLHVTEAASDAPSIEPDLFFDDEKPKGSPENLTDVMAIAPLPSEAISAFFVELAQRLRGSYQICLTKMEVETFNKQDQERNLVMVICNNHGRINADVTNALKGINECLYQRMFVIILHCQKKKHLSTEPLSGKLKADFPGVHDFVEMAFDQDLPEGIFDCEMNINALEDIAQKKDAFAKKELLISI